MKIDRKRGLSPVIATVLLVSLAIALALIVFIWLRGFLSEQMEKNGKPVENICDEIEYRLLGEHYNAGVYITLTNLGSIPISSWEVKVIHEDSSFNLRAYNNSLGIGDQSIRIDVPLGNNVKETIIYPQIVGTLKKKNENKKTTCLTKGRTINID